MYKNENWRMNQNIERNQEYLVRLNQQLESKDKIIKEFKDEQKLETEKLREKLKSSQDDLAQTWIELEKAQVLNDQ